MPDLPTVNVKVTVSGPCLGNTRVYFDGVDVTDLLMAKPFELHIDPASTDNPMLVVGLPIGELEVEMTDAALNIIGVDDKGEVA